MPFVNGKYVPGDNNKQEKNKTEKAERPRKAKAGKPEEVKLSAEELELLEQERRRQIEESAARFEQLISTDTPDLTQLNQLIEDEKKKQQRVLNKNSRSIKWVLTILLLGCVGGLFVSMAFASATLMVASLASMAVLSLVYFATVPR